MGRGAQDGVDSIDVFIKHGSNNPSERVAARVAADTQDFAAALPAAGPPDA